MEVPVSFSLAMSCVLANRVVLNSTGNRFINDEYDDTTSTSVFEPGTLSSPELGELRRMRAGKHFSELYIEERRR